MPPRLPRRPLQHLNWDEFRRDLFKELTTSIIGFYVLIKYRGLEEKSFAELHQRANAGHKASGKGKASGEEDSEDQNMPPVTSAPTYRISSTAGRFNYSFNHLLTGTLLAFLRQDHPESQPSH